MLPEPGSAGPEKPRRAGGEHAPHPAECSPDRSRLETCVRLPFTDPCSARRVEWLQTLEHALVAMAGSPWVYAALLALVIGDAFLVILPGELAVVALGALAIGTGTPNPVLLIATAALGAIVGDSACYGIGRLLGARLHRGEPEPDQPEPGQPPTGAAGSAAAGSAAADPALPTAQTQPAMRARHPLRRALRWARRTLDHRAALVIFTARYIPYARIAVNLTAGSLRFPYRRFLPLSAAAGLAWALYNVAIGSAVAAWLPGSPGLAIAISVAGAVVLGLALDRAVQRRARSAR